eukprot:g2096.t1
MSSEEAKRATLVALKAGYRHIDTAEGYKNEQGVGEAIAISGLRRDEIFVTTKVFPGGAFGQPCKTKAEVIDACKASLKNLNLSYIDLYLIHAPFAFSESLQCGLDQYRACLTLKKDRLVRFIGVSNFGIGHLEAIENANLETPFANQIELHPLCQRKELVEYMRKKNITPIAYSSLVPLSTWRALDGQRSAKPKDIASDSGLVTAATVIKSIASKNRSTEAQVLLQWALEKDFVILPKSTQEERIKENFAVAKGKLTKEDMKLLDNINEDKAYAWSMGDPMKIKIK